MLWVSNHVSWTDIPLLGMLTPLSFLSKAEVRHWPVAGWLAEKAGTLFIRGGGDGQRLREQISGQLEQRQPLLIFPEGTTTDGRSLRTFHGRLLAGAIDHGTPCSRWRSSTCVAASLTRSPPSSATTTWSRT
jgi:1-acyl-sn-glycerol-3-phosphate acyltransferase